MSPETILTNAKLVLPTEVVEGTIVLRGDRIAEVQPGRDVAGLFWCARHKPRGLIP